MRVGFVIATWIAFACSTLVAQVSSGDSSIISQVDLSLTGDNGSDDVEVVDHQSATIVPLSAIAVAGFSNANGVFNGSTSGDVVFSDPAAGSFMSSTLFSGSDSGLPNAMGAFQHTVSCEFEYQFIIDGEGTIEIEGFLSNSSTIFESFIILRMSSESTIGGGFFGFFYDETITDSANIGTVPISRSISLNAPSGSYRLRVQLISNGVGQRDLDLVTSSVSTAFQISTDEICLADINGDGGLDFFDVSAFLVAYSAGSIDADFTGDGAINFFDVSAFLSSYNAGCT